MTCWSHNSHLWPLKPLVKMEGGWVQTLNSVQNEKCWRSLLFSVFLLRWFIKWGCGSNVVATCDVGEHVGFAKALVKLLLLFFFCHSQQSYVRLYKHCAVSCCHVLVRRVTTLQVSLQPVIMCCCYDHEWVQMSLSRGRSSVKGAEMGLGLCIAHPCLTGKQLRNLF